MPVAGRKPVDGPKRNRMPPTHEWTLVADVPFEGEVPVSLPESRLIDTKTGQEVVDVSPLTAAWWADVCRMPHCVLWTATDWQFALVTALVADLAFCGDKGAAAELRQREKVLGTTMDARRDLRLRYVDPSEMPDAEKPVQATEATVSNIDDRRRRLTSA